MRNASAFLAALLVGGAAGAALAQQQAPTPVPQSVVVPSLPDQKNKEGTVSPGGGMKTDNEGWVRNNAAPVDPNAKSTETTSSRPEGPGAGPGPGVALPPPAAGPKGPAVVGAAHLTLRGVVKAYEKGVSITITQANGKNRRVPLAEKAAVYTGLAVGDKVVLRIPLGQPADGKSADRVEKQKPAKAAPPSKFAAAQSPAS